MISHFNPFVNGDNKTIFKNSEQQFELNHTKLKPKLPHILNFGSILEGEMKRKKKMAAFSFDLNLAICYGIFKPSKFNMNYQFSQ